MILEEFEQKLWEGTKEYQIIKIYIKWSMQKEKSGILLRHLVMLWGSKFWVTMNKESKRKLVENNQRLSWWEEYLVRNNNEIALAI